MIIIYNNNNNNNNNNNSNNNNKSFIKIKRCVYTINQQKIYVFNLENVTVGILWVVFKYIMSFKLKMFEEKLAAIPLKHFSTRFTMWFSLLFARVSQLRHITICSLDE